MDLPSYNCVLWNNQIEESLQHLFIICPFASACCNLQPLFQIIIRLTFFTPSLTTSLIKKFEQNVTYFVVACFINKSSSRMT